MSNVDTLAGLAALSREFGADPGLVFLGGGNTSFKTEELLYIKPSGVALATIRADQFLAVERSALRRVFTDELPADMWEREAAVKELILAAVRPRGSGRPSVETPVHEVIDFPFVFHMHPTLVNGLVCARDASSVCARLFPEALWIEYVNPGYGLAEVVAERLAAAKAERGRQPNVVFLQNHGVFVGAESVERIAELYKDMLGTLAAAYAEAGRPTELAASESDPDAVMHTAPGLRALLGTEQQRAVVTCAGCFEPADGPLSPDHIVYAKSFACLGQGGGEDIRGFRDQHRYQPKVVAVPGKAVFCAGESLAAAREVVVAARDAALVRQLTVAFGGPRYLDEAEYTFIENWEAEAYRRQVAASSAEGRRLANKVCVITGGAQGFGLGIAEGLAAAGGIVILADINLAGAQHAADELGTRFGRDRALAFEVNIADEQSVAALIRNVVHACGGLDLFVANAGVLRADSVKDMSLRDWELVTNVNYTGYFLCVKHASPVMAAQNVCGCGPWCDIVQINSKSGLEGSNRNGAYAGSKFGTIGLTQSFAKELVEDRIKVNSICPGNFFDGPLWSDPQKGLFRQYLDTGKVPGAKTLADVKRAYEEKVPMGRGCTPGDVVRAILYAVEQQYETGQAIPVTGGQVMLS